MAWLFSLTSRGLGVAIADKGKVFTANLTFEEFMSLAFSFGTGNEESAKKSERTISARHALWKDAETKTGKWTNLASRPPLWLIRHPDHWEIIEHRAEIVRQVFQWSADGLGVVKITARLNAMPNNPPWGVWRRSDGKSWCRTSVRQILMNPAVEGDLIPEAGMLFGRSLIGYFPRIVDADVVASARANQRQRSAAAGGKGRSAPTGNANLFSTVCGECGNKAHLSSSVSKGKRYAYIRCEGGLEGRCTNTAYYAYERFEQTAMDICVDLALDDRFFEASGELREARKRHAEIEKAITDKRSARKRFLDTFEDGDDQVADRIRALKAEIDDLTTALEQTKADIERASGQADAVEHLRRVTDIRQAAQSNDPMVREHARAKLRLAFGAIINSVAIEESDGLRVFTLAFLGGVIAVRIDTKGNIVQAISDIGGTAPWDMPGSGNPMLSPLLKRIRSLAA